MVYLLQLYSDADHVVLRDLAILNNASEERLNTCANFNHARLVRYALFFAGSRKFTTSSQKRSASSLHI